MSATDTVLLAKLPAAGHDLYSHGTDRQSIFLVVRRAARHTFGH